MPATTPPSVPSSEPAAKKKWGKGKIAGAIGGGCCSVVLLVFVIMVIVTIATGGADDPTDAGPATEATAEEQSTDEASTGEAESTESEPTEEPTTEPEPTEEATTEPEPEPTEEATTEEEAPAADDAKTWASSVEETALMGSADWQEMCGGDYSLGACWISDVTATNVGTLDVTIQLTGSDAEAEQLAEGAANTIFATAGPEHEDLDWVVVYGADGVVIDQKTRSDYPLL